MDLEGGAAGTDFVLAVWELMMSCGVGRFLLKKVLGAL